MVGLLKKNKLIVSVLLSILLFTIWKIISMGNCYIMVTTEPLLVANKSNNSSFILPKDTPIYKDKNQNEYYIFIDYKGRHVNTRATTGSNLLATPPSQNPENKQINFSRDNYSKAELELILKRSSLTKQEMIEVIESL